MQTIHLGGLLFETADSDELNYRPSCAITMLRAIGSSRFAVYHHLGSGAAPTYPASNTATVSPKSSTGAGAIGSPESRCSSTSSS
jgi:type IV secretory pathway VirB4 component